MMSDWNNYQPGDVLDLSRRSPADFIDEIKMDYIRPYLPVRGIILEVGAGSGRLLTRIGLEHHDTYKLIGVDYSPSAVDMIHENIIKHSLNGVAVRSDARNLDIANDSIDVVCSGGLLEHFNVDIVPVLSEMHRVLKPGGLMYADIVPRKRTLCRPRLGKHAGGYENNFSKTTWSALLKEAGFVDINIFSGLVLPPNFYGMWSGKNKMDFMYNHKKAFMSLDNTIISDVLGFAYFVFARKV